MRQLMSADEIRADPARWLAMRLQAITASDAAAISGVPGRATASGVYLHKITGEEIEDNLSMAMGRAHESVAAGELARQRPDLLLRDAGYYCHDERPWQTVTYDSWAYPRDGGDRQIVEIKTTTKPRRAWPRPAHDGGEGGNDNDKIPDGWWIQDIWQLNIAGATKLIEPVLFLPWGPLWWYEIEWDETAERDIKWLVDAAETFRTENLAKRIPPAEDWRPAVAELKRIYAGVEDRKVPLPDWLVRKLLAAYRAKGRAEDRYDAAVDLAYRRLAHARTATDRAGNVIAQRSLSWPRRIDVGRLRAERPAIAAEFTRERDETDPAQAEERFLIKTTLEDWTTGETDDD